MKKCLLWEYSFVFLLVVFSFTSFGQEVPFRRGVNFSNWFQTSSVRQVQFTKFTKKDFLNVKKLGCDVVRLPINLHAMTNGSPDYMLDPLFLELLDKVVTIAEEVKINLILDNHSFTLDAAGNTDPNLGPMLAKVWKQMASHYKKRSKYIYYEVYNEPHGIDDVLWGSIQQSAIDAIRSEDKKHFIVVGAANWNSYNNLKSLPVYADKKLIYTFHFYDPFIFTHQGASWVGPSLEPLVKVPFPYNQASMPTVPDALKGTWVEEAISGYPNDGTVNKVKQLIDIAATFKKERKVPVFCGEFGVYMISSDNSERVLWYETVRKYFNQKSIPWTMWDYTGGFGIFEKGSNELFDYDLNIPMVKALGLNVRQQKEYNNPPRKTGLNIYDDYIGEGIFEASYPGAGTLDYYSSAQPAEGKYNIYWTNVGRYDAIALDFKPNLNLSLLYDNNYYLEFKVRGNSPGAQFDLRFVDTKTSDGDHPWRLGKVIDESLAPWDGQWHQVKIPLKELIEFGSWDNGWFNPEGKFDWSAIDKLEIAPEHQDLTGIEFWFDDIKISGSVTVAAAKLSSENNLFHLVSYPNPFSGQTTVQYYLSKPGNVEISVYDCQGSKIKNLINTYKTAGRYTLEWLRDNEKGQAVPAGIYVVKISLGKISKLYKVIVL